MYRYAWPRGGIGVLLAWIKVQFLRSARLSLLYMNSMHRLLRKLEAKVNGRRNSETRSEAAAEEDVRVRTVIGVSPNIRTLQFRTLVTATFAASYLFSSSSPSITSINNFRES